MEKNLKEYFKVIIHWYIYWIDNVKYLLNGNSIFELQLWWEVIFVIFHINNKFNELKRSIFNINKFYNYLW